jgi:putative MATE family efflux protein
VEETAEASRLEAALEDPRRRLWRMALPMMIGMSLHVSYQIVDMIFVGRLSADALAALAFNLPLLFLALGITVGLGSGITAVVARCVGARDKTGADQAAENGLLLGVGLMLVFVVGGLTGGRSLLRLLGVGPDLLEPAWQYFRVMAVGFPFPVMMVFFRAILTGEGNMKTPVMVQGGATLLNVALDPIFIFTLGLGIQGAALATVLAQCVAASVYFWLLIVKSHSWVTLRPRSFRLRPSVLRSIVSIGAPSSVSFLVMALGGSVFNRILVEYSGGAVAGYQVGARLDQIVLLPMISVSTSLVTLVGMFRGSQRIDLARAIFRYALSRTVGIALLLSFTFYAFAPWLLAMFTADAEVRAAGVGYLRVAAFAYPFTAVSMLSGRAMQGLGHGIPVMVLSVMRVLLISGPMTVVVVFVLEGPLEWVWWAILSGVITTSMVALLWFRSVLRRAESEGARVQAPDALASSSALPVPPG